MNILEEGEKSDKSKSSSIDKVERPRRNADRLIGLCKGAKKEPNHVILVHMFTKVPVVKFCNIKDVIIRVFVFKPTSSRGLLEILSLTQYPFLRSIQD